MTLRMADGPPANLPRGLDAYGGYTNDSGIGETWPAVQLLPAAHHLAITTDGSPAMCADVERGAMRDWTGYPVGYCSIDNAAGLIHVFGRPAKLWTAHVDPALGDHICGPSTCGGPQADGTQCRQNVPPGYDYSLLADTFFDFLTPAPPAPTSRRVPNMTIVELEGTPELYLLGDTTARYLDGPSANGLLKSLGQSEYGPVTEAVLRGYNVIGRPAS